MAKSSKAAKKSAASAINSMEKGTLRSGKSTKKVTKPKQAKVKSLAEPKKKGAKVSAAKKGTVIKKSASKKQVSKKSESKKTVINKPVGKKSVSKKKASKKVTSKKPVVNKNAPKKSAVKNKVPQKTFPVNKKAVAKKQALKKRVKENTSLPAPTELLKELTPQQPQPNEIINPVKEPSGNALTVPVKIEDPLTSFDKHVYQKATTKGDPHSKLHLSSVNKSSIRPSGKKPLWRK